MVGSGVGAFKALAPMAERRPLAAVWIVPTLELTVLGGGAGGSGGGGSGAGAGGGGGADGAKHMVQSKLVFDLRCLITAIAPA